jgi:ABC-type uncharacterized transport system permease subunit
MMDSQPPTVAEPGLAQIALLFAAILLFAAGGLLSLLRMRLTDSRNEQRSNRIAKLGLVAGIAFALAALVWHAVRRADWIPLNDNFEAFTWIAVLLAAFVAYDQRRRSVGGLDWFVMPIVVLLLICAIAFGSVRPHRYAETAWSWAHIITAYGGSVAFAVAAAAGAAYLLASRRLRVKALGPPIESVGSLERLEHLTVSGASIGFALLTVAMTLGFLKMASEHRAPPTAKIVLTAAVLVTYAGVLHAPINPRFRGRKTAILSIAGFALMVLTLVVVQLVR